ncbi:IPT/TIG domain-containing protein [Chitinophaga sp. HK235]|uniref:IPT/TIG domain-containing protein n=1 Tax=Chitinophaga sp. HK235 TaxID=2952571 RepID=UPI001BA56A18|nr:IPT/TIG domain-containing protein [Chitinophaga sp. HK235]
MKRFLFFVIYALALSTVACRKEQKTAMVQLSVTDFLPSSGNPGTVVAVRGTGFSGNVADNNVSFNGTAARVMSANDTMLIVQAPEKGSTGAISVTIGDRTVKGGTYTYQALSIHRISPANGPEGTNVYISGAGFTGTDGPASVTINGHPAIVSNSNDTLLVAIIPANAGGGPIEISVNGEHAKGPVFNFQAISAIKPVRGGAGTKVTITGTGFSTDVTGNLVAFNGQQAMVESATATTMVVTVPDNVKTGPVSLTVNGQKTAGPVFTQVPPPSITTIAPLSGPVGSVITITGENFSELMEEDTVTINGKAVTILDASARQLVLNVPAGTTTGPLKIVVNGQQVNGPAYTVQALGIIRLVPDNGLAGSIITVKGTGFDPTPANNRVTLNGMSITVSAATDSTLTVTMPTGISTGNLNVSTGSLAATGPVFRRAGVSTYYAGPVAKGQPHGLVIDSKGNVFVGEVNKISKIAPDGTVTDFAGSATSGNQDGTGTAARFFNIYGLVMDAQDNIYVADAFNNSVRKVTPDGKVTTLMSGLNDSPRYITIDPAGNLYIGTEYNGIHMISQGGAQIKQVSRATVSAPFVYLNGYLYWSNGDANVVQRANVSMGMFSVVAGAFFQDGYVDGGLGTGRLSGPGTMIYDLHTGLIYLVDGSNYSIRAVSPVDGTISTITGAAGSYESYRYGNKNGTLQEALITPSQNSAMALDKDGNIYVLEQNLGLIRKITLK